MNRDKVVEAAREFAASELRVNDQLTDVDIWQLMADFAIRMLSLQAETERYCDKCGSEGGKSRIDLQERLDESEKVVDAALGPIAISHPFFEARTRLAREYRERYPK